MVYGGASFGRLRVLTVQIPLTQGQVALIDADDLPAVSTRKWYASKTPWGNFYAGSRGVSLHRFLMNPPNGMEVDHINRDTLDNRRSNLRIVTHAENMKNGKFALATHCPKGHPYDDSNTYRDKRGRRCKQCNSERQAELRAAETPEQRQQRTEYLRAYYAANRERVNRQNCEREKRKRAERRAA